MAAEVSDIRKLSLELAAPGDNFLIFVLRLMDIGVFGSTSTQDTYYAILCVDGVLEWLPGTRQLNKTRAQNNTNSNVQDTYYAFLCVSGELK